MRIPGSNKSPNHRHSRQCGGKILSESTCQQIKRCGCEDGVNDADAAGIAEIKYGVGKDRNGVVMMLTVGTESNIVFTDGVLVPNLEFGHLKMRDKASGKNISAEKICSDAVRKSRDLQWRHWAERFNKYLEYLHSLTWPDLMIIGGGIASKSPKYIKYLNVDCDITIAKLENRAGIIGAAYQADRILRH
ncbi:MAG: hypothetical protein ACLUKN_03675 [Bacilli bacterium]